MGSKSQFSEVGFVTAWLLFGVIAMLMTVFYLVNYPDTDIQKATWVTLSNTCSLFSAILIYQAQDEVLNLFLPHAQAQLVSNDNATSISDLLTLHHCNPEALQPLPDEIVVNFVEMLYFFIGVQVGLYFLRKRPKLMAAWSLIGSHAVGFAMLSAFYSLVDTYPFDQTGYHGLIVILICVAVIFCLSRVSRSARSLMPVDLYTHAWHHTCVHVEDEFSAFCIGFLISLVIRDLLTNCMQSIHWTPEDTGRPEKTHFLLGVAVGFGVLVIVACQIKRCTADEDEEHRSAVERMSDMFVQTMSMTMGWCLLFWGQWEFWGITDGKGFTSQGDTMVCSLEVVMCFTFGSFLILILIDIVADRWAVMEESLRALSEAFVLLLGLSWEGCFMNAFHGIQPNNSVPGVSTAVMVTAVAVLCGLVIPGWVLFILPHALYFEACNPLVASAFIRQSSQRSSASISSDVHAQTAHPGLPSKFEDLEIPAIRSAVIEYLRERGFLEDMEILRSVIRDGSEPDEEPFGSDTNLKVDNGDKSEEVCGTNDIGEV